MACESGGVYLGRDIVGDRRLDRQSGDGWSTLILSVGVSKVDLRDAVFRCLDM